MDMIKQGTGMSEFRGPQASRVADQGRGGRGQWRKKARGAKEGEKTRLQGED